MNKYIKAKKKSKMYKRQMRKMIKHDGIRAMSFCEYQNSSSDIKDRSLIVTKLPTFMNDKSFIKIRNEFLKEMKNYIQEEKFDPYTEMCMPISIKCTEFCTIDKHLDQMMNIWDIQR